MSEEEIIDIIKDFLQCQYIISTNSIRKSFLSVYQEAIQGLLDLYKQEKEKNKELEEHQKQYLDGELITAKQGKLFEKMIKENYIRKDKIREKIEKFKCETTWNYNDRKYDKKVYNAECKIIDMLEKELLEEE